jgi:WD40 repeat protein
VDQTMDNVLYTFCADNVLRIWTGSDSHGQQHVQLWGTIDLAAAIQDNAVQSMATTLRWAWIMHGRDFSAAVEQAVLKAGSPAQKGDAVLQHLIAVANRSPEVCVVLNGRGQMSAWGLENVGSKSQTPGKVFNIAHVKSSDFDFLQGNDPNSLPHVEVHSFCNKPDRDLYILIHYFNGVVEIYQRNIARFIDVNPKVRHLSLRHIWAGHSAPVEKIVRNFSGRAIVSRTAEGESILWKHGLHSKQPTLSRQAVISQQGHIHRTCVLRKGRFVVFLRHDTLALWDCRQAKPVLLAESNYEVPGKPLCLLILPRQRVEDYTTAHIATITSEKRGVVWEVKLPSYSPDVGIAVVTNGHEDASIREFFRFDLAHAGDLAYVLPVDPAGSSSLISGFLDVFARDVAISYTHSGRVEFWTARVDESRSQVEWLSTSSMETGVSDPALVSGSTMKKAALVNSTRTSVTIWDIRGARLEYSQDYESQNTIQDLDWTSTPDTQSILAVGFPFRVVLISQMRFDYLNKGPAWAPIREIDIRDLTPHPIGDSTWLGDGNLVIGAGNQLFAYDRHFDVSSSLVTTLRLPHRKEGLWDLFDVVQRLNGPLPVFHPQFLSQCILSGKLHLVHLILMALQRTLRYWVEGESIDDYLGIDMENFYRGPAVSSGYTCPLEGTADVPQESARNPAQNESGSYFNRRMSYDDSEEKFSEEVAQDISERLTKVGLAQLSGHEQIQLMDIVECVGLVEKQRRSLDENGARFMLFFRQHALRKGRTDEISMSWREINWAYHSTSQDILVDFVSRQHHGRLVWEHARESGMFMWLTDNAAVVCASSVSVQIRWMSTDFPLQKAQFEIVARNEYTKSEVKDPINCSLFYLALKKKTVLQGLWRMASWNREQAATLKLLANNFDDPRWKTSALKNAYALMSRRRFGKSHNHFQPVSLVDSD